jgi:antitoxin HicB
MEEEVKLEREPIEYYLNLSYPITIHVDPEGGYVSEIEDLPGCLAQGETLNEAHELIEVARRMWIKVAYEDGQDIPLPRDNQEYSGKFLMRTPKSLHRKLDRMAVREGVSLNQFVVSTLSEAVGYREASQKKVRVRYKRK